MPLYVDLSGYPVTVETDLFHICHDDGGFGDAPVPGDSTAVQITYNQSMSSFGGDRLHDIVNNTAHLIVITGVDSTSYIDGISITMIAGVTFTDPNNAQILRIIYDTSQCGGNGYCVFDVSSNTISFPGDILCFHEMAHAYRVDQGMAFGEFEAISDENGLRQENVLPLRDPNNHNGHCGCAVGGGGGDDGDCFIVSAVSGSEGRTRINRLRHLRDFYLRRSALGVKFFDEFWDEYYQFSPKIASDIRLSSTIKYVTSTLCVEPLLHFLNLLELYLTLGCEKSSFSEQVKDSVQRFSANLSRSNLTSYTIQSLPVALRIIKEYLIEKKYCNHEETPDINTGSIAMDGVLQYLAGEISSRLHDIRYITWAIMDPVIYFWQLVCILKDDTQREFSQLIHFSRWVNEWLSGVPIYKEFEKLEMGEVRASLSQLASTVFICPSVRRRFGERLLNQYGSIVSYDLKAVLQEVDYVVKR